MIVLVLAGGFIPGVGAALPVAAEILRRVPHRPHLGCCQQPDTGEVPQRLGYAHRHLVDLARLNPLALLFRAYAETWRGIRAYVPVWLAAIRVVTGKRGTA